VVVAVGPRTAPPVTLQATTWKLRRPRLSRRAITAFQGVAVDLAHSPTTMSKSTLGSAAAVARALVLLLLFTGFLAELGAKLGAELVVTLAVALSSSLSFKDYRFS